MALTIQLQIQIHNAPDTPSNKQPSPAGPARSMTLGLGLGVAAAARPPLAGRAAETGRLDVSEAGSGTTLLRVVDRAFVSGDAL